MRRKARAIKLSLSLSICLLLVAVLNVSGEEYEALSGLESVKAVFDVRVGNPKSTALQLKLIQQTFKDRSSAAITKKPAFEVVFMGPAVKLVSEDREDFSSEEHKILDEIAGTISEMSKDGIKLEICLFAAKLFRVDPASVLPGIRHVANGWISLIGYQARGYSLVPVY